MWRTVLKKLLEELYIAVEPPIKIYCDNKVAISISLTPVQHDRTKHVEVGRHFIKEKVDEGTICMTYVSTKEKTADILTKRLSRQDFDDLVCKLDMINNYDPTWGKVLVTSVREESPTGYYFPIY